MCPKLATNNYSKRHNNVAAVLHRNICQHCGIKTSKTPWIYHPEVVTENNEVKVLCDFEIRIDKVAKTRNSGNR